MKNATQLISCNQPSAVIMSWKNSLGFGGDNRKQDFDSTRVDYLEVTAEKQTPPQFNFQGTWRQRPRKSHLLIPSLETTKLEMFLGNEQGLIGEKTRSTNKAVKIITSSPRILEFTTIRMDVSVEMEMKHNKLLLAPCPNASQPGLQIIRCLSFHWKSSKEIACYARLTDADPVLPAA